LLVASQQKRDSNDENYFRVLAFALGHSTAPSLQLVDTNIVC
jgi:hypothetical protein